MRVFCPSPTFERKINSLATLFGVLICDGGPVLYIQSLSKNKNTFYALFLTVL